MPAHCVVHGTRRCKATQKWERKHSWLTGTAAGMAMSHVGDERPGAACAGSSSSSRPQKRAK
jgi:hypothetical protein